MSVLTRLPGSRRSPHGFEWVLWKRLPAILLLGTVLPIGAGLIMWWLAPAQPTASETSDLLRVVYQLAGLVLLHWTLVLTVAIGCIVVLVMKGPAYVADPYPPPGRD
jgi:hypothetical protein